MNRVYHLLWAIFLIAMGVFLIECGSSTLSVIIGYLDLICAGLKIYMLIVDM